MTCFLSSKNAVDGDTDGNYGDGSCSSTDKELDTIAEVRSWWRVDLGVENDIQVYPGVGHAFANPSGSNYAEEETRDAWARTVTFLNENLK